MIGEPIIGGWFLQNYALVTIPAACMAAGFLRPRLALPAFILSVMITYYLWPYGWPMADALNIFCCMGVLVWPYSMGDWRKESVFIDYLWIGAALKKVVAYRIQ